MKKYFILSTSQGCVTNFNEESLYSKYLSDLGYTQSQNKDDADIFILNTCSYVQATHDVSVKLIEKSLTNKNVIVTGCYPNMYKAEFDKYNIRSFTPGNLEELAKHINTKYKHTPIKDNYIEINNVSLFDTFQRILFFLRKVLKKHKNPFYHDRNYFQNFIDTITINPDFFTIRTGIGCLGHCTYCGIRKSKGKIKSKSFGAIIGEVERAKEENISVICLSGEDVGCWGYDISSNSAELLEKVLECCEDIRIVIEYFDPKWLVNFKDRLIPIFSDKRIISVTFAMQSGSSNIIRKMGREYDPKEVYAITKKIKRNNPSLIIKTNTIAGFPGETWLDFAKSIRSLFYFDGSAIDSYTRVDGTPAAKYKKQCSKPIKEIRKYILITVNLSIIVKNIMLGLFNKRRSNR